MSARSHLINAAITPPAPHSRGQESPLCSLLGISVRLDSFMTRYRCFLGGQWPPMSLASLPRHSCSCGQSHQRHLSVASGHPRTRELGPLATTSCRHMIGPGPGGPWSVLIGSPCYRRLSEGTHLRHFRLLTPTSWIDHRLPSPGP